MARILGAAVNELKLFDHLSNTDILFLYRMPTTQERAAYSNEAYQRKRNKVVSRLSETRLKYGARILIGIRDGDFVVMRNGTQVPIASDGASPNFDAQWKNHVVKDAADLVEVLAATVFDSSAEQDTGEELPEETDLGEAE